MGLYIDERWDTFRMLCVDPGLHYIGMSVHELETRTGRYKKIDIETLNVDRAFRRSERDDDFMSVADSCLRRIRNHTWEVINDYGISYFAYESPFYSPLMPGAYGTLCEVVSSVRQTVLDYNPYIYIDSMSPQNVKKGMGAGGTKGKEIMYEKVTGTKELMDALNCPVQDLTEHCIDSMAVGYNARKTILAPMEGWKL